ncbi:hypothetical protein C8J57DRAFT_1516860 [Mycena rebaudengoi]|nr:hypothetical protein C8J57DRAFT_1516860 [Mycena rebaudengoi]
MARYLMRFRLRVLGTGRIGGRAARGGGISRAPLTIAADAAYSFCGALHTALPLIHFSGGGRRFNNASGLRIWVPTKVAASEIASMSPPLINVRLFFLAACFPSGMGRHTHIRGRRHVWLSKEDKDLVKSGCTTMLRPPSPLLVLHHDSSPSRPASCMTALRRLAFAPHAALENYSPLLRRGPV